MFKSLVISVFVLILTTIDTTISHSTPDQLNSNPTTLRLLQIVHRHGERTALKNSLPKTDPFKDESTYWYEGFGQLTNEGKLEMYKIGKYIRERYGDYLGDQFSPREVYVRSSIEHRCIESASCLLAGAYPPNNPKWEWGENSDPPLAKLWQPFPIETFMPKDEDTLLVPHKKCPKATEEHQSISDSKRVQKILSDFHDSDISKYLERVFNESIDSLYRGQQFWDTLNIEWNRHNIWNEFNSSAKYTQEQAIEALDALNIGSYVNDWDTEFIRRIRIGKLMETLVTNMKTTVGDVQSDRKYKLYVYSTHDTIVVPLLQALEHYNNKTPTYGASVVVELHQNLTANTTDNEYSVVVYYYFDNTLTGGWNYTLNEFETKNKKYFYTDFNHLCGIDTKDNLLLSEMTFMLIGIGIGIALLGLNMLAIKFIKARKAKHSFQLSK